MLAPVCCVSSYSPSQNAAALPLSSRDSPSRAAHQRGVLGGQQGAALCDGGGRSGQRCAWGHHGARRWVARCSLLPLTRGSPGAGRAWSVGAHPCPATTAGSITASFAALHDYRGRPRRLEATQVRQPPACCCCGCCWQLVLTLDAMLLVGAGCCGSRPRPLQRHRSAVLCPGTALLWLGPTAGGGGPPHAAAAVGPVAACHRHRLRLRRWWF